jgi:hypothetical protein
MRKTSLVEVVYYVWLLKMFSGVDLVYCLVGNNFWGRDWLLVVFIRMRWDLLPGAMIVWVLTIFCHLVFAHCLVGNQDKI